MSEENVFLSLHKVLVHPEDAVRFAAISRSGIN